MPFFMVLQPFLQECLYRKMGPLYLHKAHGLVPRVGLVVVIFWVSTLALRAHGLFTTACVRDWFTHLFFFLFFFFFFCIHSFCIFKTLYVIYEQITISFERMYMIF